MPSDNTPPPVLSVDPLWPRAGDWPSTTRLPPDLTLVGVPTWRTSLSYTNAHQTPDAIRDALRKYGAFASLRNLGPADLNNELIIRDAGNIVDPDHGPGEERAITAIRALAQKTRLLMAIGGDNAATVPAALGAWGDRIDTAGLITLDAHHDLRDGISNGSPVRRLVEAGLHGRRIVQVGIADFANSIAYSRRAQQLGITVVTRQELFDRPITAVIAQALEIAGAAGGPIHVDIDVDVCDRAATPACPASVPGGISAAELKRAVRELARDSRVRSFDIAEIDASADAPDGRTVRLGANLVLEAAAGLAERLHAEELALPSITMV